MAASVLACMFMVVTASVGQAGAAASRSHSSASSAAKALTTVTFETDYLPNGKYSPFIYGVKKGYFRKEGIKLNLIYGKGSGLTIDSVATGKVDIGMVDSGVLALSVGKTHTPLKSVGLYYARNDFAFFVPSTSSVKKISQLAGKSLIVAPGTPQAIVTPAVLKLAGISVSAVHEISISPALADSTYAKGTGDAIGEAVNFSPIFAQTRPSRALPWVNVGYKTPGFSFAVTDNTLKTKPGLIARFLTATYRSVAASLQHPTAATSAYERENSTLSITLIKKEWTLTKPYFCTPTMVKHNNKLGYQTPGQWSKALTLLKKYSTMPASVMAKEVYTNQLFTKNKVSSSTCKKAWS